MDDLDYLKSLNTQQYEAVTHAGTPLLILAGAGSGKTRVITTRIAYLIDRMGIDPRSILAVTFTNKAAREMSERARALSPLAHSVMIRTFHSFGAWLLRRNASLAGLNPGFTIYDDDDALNLLHTVQDGRKKQDLRRFNRMISRAKDYALGPEDDLTPISSEPDLARLYAAYQKRLDEMGNVDFGDLILKPMRLLEESEILKNRFHQRFRIVMVDEYQDSNVAQYLLLKALAGPQTEVCVVGDEDQSIYRFRGAEVRNILNFPEEFVDTRVIRLEENYRSTGSILAIASGVIANNSERLGKNLWTRRDDGLKAKIVYLRDQDEEADYCARLLAEDRRYGETAILYRTNAQSLAFETAFLRRGIPYRIVGSLRFYEREEVKDVLALLALLSNPLDEIAYRRVVNKPARGIGAASLEKILEASGGGDLIDGSRRSADSLSKRAAAGLSAFVGLIDRAITALPEAPLAELVELLIKDSGLYEYHAEQDEIAAGQKTANLEELVNAAADYGRGEEALYAFLEDINLDRSRMAEQEETGEFVTLITMHNTKGLEFPRVIITGMEEELFPGSAGYRDVDYEEERRIFYVSLTRAMDELILTSCRSRFIWGRRNLQSPSCFLREIPAPFAAVEGDDPGFSSGLAYSPGDGIYHDAYGTGVVVKSWRNGESELIVVRFESGRTATFYPEYETHLERIAVDEF